jgi:hypothetical protein
MVLKVMLGKICSDLRQGRHLSHVALFGSPLKGDTPPAGFLQRVRGLRVSEHAERLLSCCVGPPFGG